MKQSAFFIKMNSVVQKLIAVLYPLENPIFFVLNIYFSIMYFKVIFFVNFYFPHYLKL